MKTLTVTYDRQHIETHTECRTCLFDSSIAKIHEDGECEYCKLQTKLRNDSPPEKWDGILSQIRKKGKGRKYDILCGISGGEDSSIMLRKISYSF